MDNKPTSKNENKKIVILNMWQSLNYGAILTAYALQQSLKKAGYDSRLADYAGVDARQQFEASVFKPFADRFLQVTEPFLHYEELAGLNRTADIFVVGSDQVFRQKYNRKCGFYFYLPFADADKKKIACAASFGVDVPEGSESDRRLMAYYLSLFDDVSVREDSGVKLCREEFGREARQISDPVFWLSAEEWGKPAEGAGTNAKDFGLTYVLDKEQATNELVAAVHKKFAPEMVTDMGNARKKEEQLPPEQWLYNIKNCRYLVTDSFHGVCFAIIFNKPFVCIANRARGASRFESLFRSLGLSSRLLFNNEDIAARPEVFEPVDYAAVNARLAAEAARSREWLEEALKRDKSRKTESTAAETFLLQELGRSRAEICGLEERINLMGRMMIRGGLLAPQQSRCLRYRLLAALTFGKARKKYKAKRKECEQKLRSLKKLLKGC